MKASGAALTESLANALGPRHVLTDSDVVASYTTDWTGRFSGPAALVVRPGSTDEVAEVLRICVAAEIPVVTQGGNTGLVGGSVPDSAGNKVRPVVLSTTRLVQIGPVDTVAQQVTAGAGVTLSALQAVAHSAGMKFPVDLAARDSATLGGMMATNAGGVHVLRYGTMRRQILGAEAVLADGRILAHLGGLIKDNTGYDWTQLLVGSEGTLAVITAVRLRLVSLERDRAVAIVGVDTTAAAVAIACHVRQQAPGLSAAELFYNDGLDLVCRHAGFDRPFLATPAVYLLLEVVGNQDPVGELAAALSGANLLDEATAVSSDEVSAGRLWAYRERHSDAVASIGVPHKLDVTLPLVSFDNFERSLRRIIDQMSPGSTVVLWGHIVDGNLHVNIIGPPADDKAIDEEVLKLAADHGGSISAEHGIGRAKACWLGLSRSPVELATMRAIKDALDPQGILNPGVLLPELQDLGT